MTAASIITIGDELLIGQIIDTNSAWMAQELNKAGITVRRRIAVGDHKEEIIHALNEESTFSDIILLTGGLGPTADDITKPLLCEYFEGKMMVNEAALKNVIHLIEEVYKRPMNERNRKQAEVPDTCTVLINPRGTAPGMWFEKNNRIFVSMPGVPHEMKGLMEEEVLPRLKNRFQHQVILHRTLVTYGIGESMLADELESFEQQLPEQIKLAYLPHHGMIRLRLTATGEEVSTTEKIIEDQKNILKATVIKYLISEEDAPMEKIVSKLLKERNQTLCTAESCTGGYIAHLITSLAGSSLVYKGSFIAYAYEIKESILDVDRIILEDKGAVSEEVVRKMAFQAREKMNTDYALAVSGIMGPDGGTETKPVGTVWVAVADAHQVLAKKFHVRFDRIKNIQLTALNSLNMLREFIAVKMEN